MEFCSIASSSSGNCLYVGSDQGHYLIDAGLSGKKIEEGLNQNGITTKEIDGIFVTHEHIDHIKGLGVLARKYQIPIYATKGTVDGILSTKSVGNIDRDLFIEIESDVSVSCKDMVFTPHRIWHDANEPVCYTVESKDKKISIATDLGNYDSYLVDKLKDADLLFIEANHDIRMLEVGPYPYKVKQRILSNFGHLSNERAGQFILELLNSHIQHIFLEHLSKENNMDELAYQAVKCELLENPFTNQVEDFKLKVAKKENISKFVTI